MAPTLKEFNKACWSEVYNRIIGAVVYIDNYSAECLHWNGGLFSLLTGGASAVKSLSPFEVVIYFFNTKLLLILCLKNVLYFFYVILQSSGKEHRKAVFITQTTNTQLQSIREIILHSDFTHCILISCVSLDIVYMELNDNKDVSDTLASGRAPAEATKQLENMLLEWIAKSVCNCTIYKIDINQLLYHTN